MPIAVDIEKEQGQVQHQDNAQDPPHGATSKEEHFGAGKDHVLVHGLVGSARLFQCMVFP
jgi:hypothetical protein